MSATPEQIAAAAKALRAQANAKIAALPMFEQGMARQALNDQLIGEFAKAAADAVAAVKET